jgi:glycosyltransferase involved in cell wall biosynthesis
METANDPCLHVVLDTPLPAALSVGEGTALFVGGTCFHERAEIALLRFVAGGRSQPVAHHGMPRLDLLRSLHPTLDPYATGTVTEDPDSPDDPRLHSYLSGFWGIVEIAAGTAGPISFGLSATLSGGGEAVAELGSIELCELRRAGPVAPPGPDAEPLVAICMAAYEPPSELFAAQIESIRAQTHRNWICVISDDCSSDRGRRTIAEVIGDDPRFLVSRSERRLGFYRNFERALGLAPANARYVALTDQDDRWDPDKLATLIAAIGGAELVYSDQRVIDRHGALISSSYWGRRRNNHSDLLSVLVANSVTGAASLMRAELLDHVLPFPPAQFAHFHDHWIALVALSIGDIAYVDRPLYDYVQHADATLGHAAANEFTGLRERFGRLRGDPRERVRMWRLHYFVDVARLQQLSAILRLRVGARMAPAKLRSLRHFTAADTSLVALARLWRRGARELVGTQETLGAEWMLAYALSWRRLLALTTRSRPVRSLRFDAVPPPDLVLAPGRQVAEHAGVREIADKIGPLRLAVSDPAPTRVNLLIPTIDLGHFFGGYIGKFNLARRLADAGLRVRIVTVDPVGHLPRDWRDRVQRYAGLKGMLDRVEVTFGREAQALEVSRRDVFVATTWWTAHIADAALTELGRERFLYLIQEYEPFTFPMGTYAALAMQSYSFAHTALFSTELLREYFRRHAIGVYAGGVAAGDARSESFQNAITPVRRPTVADLAGPRPRRLLFYARPEAHASRNMFELGVLALTRAVAAGAFSGWELRGIGAIGSGSSLTIARGARLQMVPRADQGSYGDLLRGHDVGLALMLTPHPSLVPIEMASAGMLAVTNSFENKTAAAMRRISPNLLAPEPTVAAVADALTAAASAVGDLDGRVRGAAVNWSSDWGESLPDSLIARVVELIGS